MGARQADRSGIATSPSTLLRHLMQLPAPLARAVRVLGVEDFGATRKVAYVAVRTLERRILPGVLPSVPYQAESSAPGTM